MIVPFNDAVAWVKNVFMQLGAAENNAQSVAQALLAAEADGLKGHGLSRVPTYGAMLKSGKIDGKAMPQATRPKPGVLVIDAAHGFAYPALDLALARAPDIAREQGIVAVSVMRSNHCGAAGLPCEALARQGFVAMLYANTPAAIAPWGGKRAVFGTNPIAFAAPLATRDPVVIDLAVSKVARGPIVAAKQKGEKIPEGWALDPDGNPTTEPDKALAGTMVPLGDAKGSSLAFMVETLAACLTGANLAFEASSFLDEKGGPPSTGQLMIVIDPAAFGHARFGERMAVLAQSIEDQDGARLSGMRRYALRKKAHAAGVAIPPEVRSAVEKLLA